MKFQKKCKSASRASSVIEAATSTTTDTGSRTKFANLGLTQYDNSGSSKPRLQGNSFGNEDAEKGCAGGRKNHVISKKVNMKGKPKCKVHILPSDNSNPSSDEMNLTDSSQPVETPIKHSRHRPPQRFEDSGIDDTNSTSHMHMNPRDTTKSEFSSSVQSKSKTKAKAKEDENSFCDVSKPTPRVKPRRTYGRSREIEDLSTGSAVVGNDKGKDKVTTALNGISAFSSAGSATKTGSMLKDKGKSRKKGSSNFQKNPIEIMKDEQQDMTPQASRTDIYKWKGGISSVSGSSSTRSTTKERKKPEPTPFPMNKLAATSDIRFTIQQRNRSNYRDAKDEDNENDDDPLSMDDTDEILNRGGPRPFPMTSQDFMGFSDKPISNSSTVSGFTKRSSESDEQVPSKRSRRTIRLSDLNDTGDFSFTQPEECPDPKTLCPYCDMSFPSDPSPLLRDMLTRIRKISYRDPRPSNALGLKAPLLNYVNLCQRHQFETTLLPQARANGWPTHINFVGLPARVKEMQKHLKDYMLDKGSSLFWCELKKDIDRKGVRKAMGIAAQFNTFEKSQPGYYGEQGSVIIYQTLYSLFPPESIDADRVAPLTPTEFIQRVLVPETAAALVQQDMGFGNKEDAVQTLRESSKFGTAMFPDIDNHDGGNASNGAGAVSDKMVWERARARQKEIEEEDRMDNELEELDLEKGRLKKEANLVKGKTRRSRSDMNAMVDVRKLTRETKKGRVTAAETTNNGNDIIELSDSSSARTDDSTIRRENKGKVIRPFYATDSSSQPISQGSSRDSSATRQHSITGVFNITPDMENEATPKPLMRFRSECDIMLPELDNRYEKNGKAANSRTGASKLSSNTRPLEAVKTKGVSRSSEFVFTMKEHDEVDDIEERSRSLRSYSRKDQRALSSSQNSNKWLYSEDSSPLL